MDIGWLNRHRYRGLLPAVNLAGCALFVALRPADTCRTTSPTSDEVRRTGGFVINSSVSGMVACRQLYPWDEWHGGEGAGVKILEVANAPAVAMTVGTMVLAGETGLARRLSACAWSWVLAGVFAVTASAQWWLTGIAIDAVRHRRRDAAGDRAIPGPLAMRPQNVKVKPTLTWLTSLSPAIR